MEKSSKTRELSIATFDYLRLTIITVSKKHGGIDAVAKEHRGVPRSTSTTRPSASARHHGLAVELEPTRDQNNTSQKRCTQGTKDLDVYIMYKHIIYIYIRIHIIHI